MRKRNFTEKDAVKLHLSYLREVRNYEFFVFYQELVEMLGNYEFELPTVEALLERVTRHRDKLEELNKQPTAHRLSPAIDDTSDSLRNVLSALRSTVDATAKSTRAEDKEHGRVLSFWIRKVRDNMTSYAKVRQAKAVMALQNDFALNPAVGEALEAAGLTAIYDRVVSLFKELEEMKQIRVDDWSKLKAKRDGMRRDIVRDLTLLLRSLAGLANMEWSERSYFEELCNSINELLSRSRTIHLARLTRFETKRLAEMADEDEDDEMSAGNFDLYDDFEQWDEGQLGI